MAKEIKVEVNFETKDAQKNAKDLDKDFSNLGDSAEDSGNKIKGAGGGAEKSGDDAKKGAKGWNIFGKALRMTGIGALVGVLFKFSEVLMGNQRVMDAVNTVANTMSIIFSDLVNFVIDANNKVMEFTAELGSLQDIFGNVKEKILDFGDTIKTYIIDSVKQTIEGVGLLGKAIGKLFKGEFKEAGEIAKEGVKTIWNANPVVDLTKKTAKYAKEVLPKVIEKTKELIEKGKDYIETTIDEAKAIVDTENELTKKIGTLEKERGAIQKNIDEKTRQRDNENLTFEQRKQSANELLKLEKDLLDNQIELQKARVENLEAELRVNEDNLQMKQELAVAQAKLTELENKDVEQITAQTQAIHDLTVAQGDSIREIEMLSKFGQEREMEELKKHNRELLEQARKSGADQSKVLEHYEMKKKEIRNKAINATLQAGADLMGALAGQQEEGSKKWKKMATAEALINTYLGVTKALSDREMPFVARMLNAGTQLVMGLNNVKAIKETEMEGAEGGDDVSASGVSMPIPQGSPIAGAFEEMIPNQLTEETAGTGSTPVQAFVVETDISSSQALQEELNLQSTL